MRENQKPAKTSFPSREKIKNQRELTFPRRGKTKNAENYSSLASDERKTMKTTRRLCFFIENYQKQRFACER